MEKCNEYILEAIRKAKELQQENDIITEKENTHGRIF